MKHSFPKRLTALLLMAMMIVAMVPAFVIGAGAEETTLTFDMSKNPGSWPTANETTLKNYTYTLDGTAYTFALKNVKCNSGYLMMNKTGSYGVLGLPAIEGKKLTQVVVTNSGGCSTSVTVGISSSDSAFTAVTGGESQTWSTKSGTYTYNLTGTTDNTMYYLCVTNEKNAQVVSIALTYETLANLDCEHLEKVAIGEAKDATCTEDGITAGEKCKDCGATLEAQETIPATGHNYVDGVCTKCDAVQQLYQLLKDASQLKVGDKIIIVAANSDFAMSTTQGNNRGPVAITTKDGNTITLEEDMQVLTIEAGTKDGTFAFNTDAGYLYAASSSANHLKIEEELSDNSSWTIEINSAGVATVKAQGSNTRNWLRHNDSNNIFSCYGSGQKDIAIYKYVDPNEPSLDGFSLTLNKGVTVKVTYTIPASWLTANPNAKVVFSNGTELEAKAGENVYSVTLTPAQINMDLTVKLGDMDAQDVSVATYKAKVEAAESTDKLGLSDEKYAALKALLDSIVTYGQAAAKTLEGSVTETFEGVADVVIDETQIDAFASISATLGESATLNLNLNAANLAGYTITLKVGGITLLNGDTAPVGSYTIKNLYPAHFNDEISVTITNGTDTATASFTFNAYLKALYNATDSSDALKNLAAATYRYGVAAEAFKTAA